MKLEVKQCFALFFIIIININSSSCENNDTAMYRIYHGNGNIYIEQEMVNDSVKHGYYKRFYSNGNLEVLINYRNNEKEGEEIGYYKDGNIEYIALNRNGKVDSIITWYYKNGAVESKYSYTNNLFFGNQYNFDTTGKLVSFFFNNYSGYSVFSVEYDKDSLTIDGNPIYAILNNDTLEKGDSFNLNVFFAIPPNFIYNMKIIENENSVNELLVPLKKSFMYKSAYSYNKVIDTDSLKYEIKIILEDTINGIVFKDSTSFEVSIE